MKKVLASLLAVVMLLVSSGCADNTKKPNNQPIDEPAEKEENVEVVLRMGYRALIDNFTSVKTTIKAPVTPEKLIDAIAKEGGWNLELVDDVRKDNDGYHVKFTSNSLLGSGENLFVGNPGEQKKEYFCYDGMTLTELILGSIQATFDENLAEKGTTMKIYFSVLGNPIKVDEKHEFEANKPWNDIYDKYQISEEDLEEEDEE